MTIDVLEHEQEIEMKNWTRKSVKLWLTAWSVTIVTHLKKFKS